MSHDNGQSTETESVSPLNTYCWQEEKKLKGKKKTSRVFLLSEEGTGAYKLSAKVSKIVKDEKK